MTKPLTHIQHPEDLILSGEPGWLTPLQLIKLNHISVKIDGHLRLSGELTHKRVSSLFQPSLLFNKKKDKICYTIDDVRNHFKGVYELQDILITCLMNLPVTEGVSSKVISLVLVVKVRNLSLPTLSPTPSLSTTSNHHCPPHTYYEVDSDTHMSQQSHIL